MSSTTLLRVVTRDVATETRPLTVVTCVEQPMLGRTVQRVLRALGATTSACVDPYHMLEQAQAERANLLIYEFDAQTMPPEERARVLADLSSRPDAPPVILISQEREPASLATLLMQKVRGGLIAKLGPIDGADLLVTIRKLVEQDIFGVEKYLSWGAVITRRMLAENRDRGATLEHLETFLGDLGCGRRTAQELLTVADEFLMNALYDAPTDETGRHIHAHKDRREPVKLAANRHVQLEFGSDGERFAIGCRDPFGSLVPQIVLDSLARCLKTGSQVSMGPGGAGVGLFMSYQAVDHLVVNIEQQAATEFIGLVDIAAVRRERHARGKSLNIFTLR